MSQPLEAMFQENPNKLINIEHTYGFDESSPLVPSSSSLLREVEPRLLGSGRKSEIFKRFWFGSVSGAFFI